LRPDEAPPVPVLIEGESRIRTLREAEGQPETPDQYVVQITELWQAAQKSFIAVGKLLLKAKETLPHGEYMAEVEARLPFISQRTAYQLREAARWTVEMDRRKMITLERLPSSYSTIYLLSTFDPPTLEAAQTEGLVRPDLRRAELIRWRQERAGGAEGLHQRRSKLLREKARLQAELMRIEEELREAAD
jgi:hypothetical protein